MLGEAGKTRRKKAKVSGQGQKKKQEYIGKSSIFFLLKTSLDGKHLPIQSLGT